jgi:hypothetical protein
MAIEQMTRPLAARRADVGSETLLRGTVRAVTGRVIAVERDGMTCMARRAASCLIAPRAGDVVLYAEVDGATYVLAVLERDDPATELDVEGDLTLCSRGGSIRVDAMEGDLELSAAHTARLRGKVMALVAEESTWVGRELRMLGEQLTLDATRIRQVSTFAERVADSVKETFGRSYRDVAEGEHVRAGSVTFSLRHMLRCHAETAVVTAKKLIKLDGDQIHLG